MVYNGKPYEQMDDLGENPPFKETPICPTKNTEPHNPTPPHPTPAPHPRVHHVHHRARLLDVAPTNQDRS